MLLGLGVQGRLVLVRVGCLAVGVQGLLPVVLVAVGVQGLLPVVLVAERVAWQAVGVRGLLPVVLVKIRVGWQVECLEASLVQETCASLPVYSSSWT